MPDAISERTPTMRIASADMIFVLVNFQIRLRSCDGMRIYADCKIFIAIAHQA